MEPRIKWVESLDQVQVIFTKTLKHTPLGLGNSGVSIWAIGMGSQSRPQALSRNFLTSFDLGIPPFSLPDQWPFLTVKSLASSLFELSQCLRKLKFRYICLSLWMAALGAILLRPHFCLSSISYLSHLYSCLLWLICRGKRVRNLDPSFFFWSTSQFAALHQLYWDHFARETNY